MPRLSRAWPLTWRYLQRRSARQPGTIAFCLVVLWLVALWLAMAMQAVAQDRFDQPPIEYRHREPNNRVSQLQAQLESGTAQLAYDDEYGYLPALLKALDVPVESQMLVFSKSSLQIRLITPKTPRAVYFGDEVYLGYCQSGDVIEVSTADPQLGAVFYTLDQRPRARPRFDRQTDRCLLCHNSARTHDVPGHLVRSLLVDSDGQSVRSHGLQVDHTTPLERRWGGWYVTGTHGDQPHLGNLTLRGRQVPVPLDNEQGHNVEQLADRFDTSKYLSPHSDIVALMVLEHQTLVHNRITLANFATRTALYEERQMNETLNEQPDHRLESTERRIASAGESLLDALLMVGEIELTSPIRGTSGYAEQFMRRGSHDGQGRSLRQLDLERRLFKYPCSYLIESPAIDALPPQMHAYLWRRLGEVLSGRDRDERFAHLGPEDRQAIVEILRAVKKLPASWPESE